MFRNAVPGAQLLHRSTNVNLCTLLKMYVRGFGRQPTFLANMMLHFYCLFFFFCSGIILLPWSSCSPPSDPRSYTASLAFLFFPDLILLPQPSCFPHGLLVFLWSYSASLFFLFCFPGVIGLPSSYSAPLVQHFWSFRSASLAYCSSGLLGSSSYCSLLFLCFLSFYWIGFVSFC